LQTHGDRWIKKKEKPLGPGCEKKSSGSQKKEILSKGFHRKGVHAIKEKPPRDRSKRKEKDSRKRGKEKFAKKGLTLGMWGGEQWSQKIRSLRKGMLAGGGEEAQRGGRLQNHRYSGRGR